jgi:hypothetical protein
MVSSSFDRNAAGSFFMQRAFTGALTADWEADRAYDIVTEQTQRKRLPRLVLLDLVHERQRRRPNEPVLITSLMKYVFLLQKEETTGQMLYHFVPYKYGPFARELYQDLEAPRLNGEQYTAEGFISVTECDEERTEIALGPSKETTIQEVECPTARKSPGQRQEGLGALWIFKP